MDEALLIGEAAYLNYDALYESSLLYQSPSLSRDGSVIHTLRSKAIKKYEQALVVNPANIITMYCIIKSGLKVLEHCREVQDSVTPAHYPIPSVQTMVLANASERFHCDQQEYECCLNLIDHGFDAHGQSRMHILRDVQGQPKVHELAELHNILGNVFHENGNIPETFKYAKITYETCLRSSLKTDLSVHKNNFMQMKATMSEEPPLRFAVGDEVQFLPDGGDEWRLGKVIEVYYHERSFPLVFTAPYRLQLLESSGSVIDPPVYAYVRADLDRYIRKVGVRSMEDTRYQA